MLNAFYGNKKVIIVNESGCKLGKEITAELRKNNFNNVTQTPTMFWWSKKAQRTAVFRSVPRVMWETDWVIM